MLDRKTFLQQPEVVLTGLQKRGKKFADEAKSIVNLLEKNQGERQALEILQSELNVGSKRLTQAEGDERKSKLAELKKLSEKVKLHEARLRAAEAAIDLGIQRLPNIPLEDVPVGKSADDNTVLREVGERPELSTPKDYLSLAESLGIIDVQRAAKASGSRFGYLVGSGALLEFALLQYAIKGLLEAGFTPMIPPVLVKEEIMAGMGYLAQGGADEVYHFPKDKQYLVGTSEQTLGAYHADEVLRSEELPKKYAGFSTCFRREAGSYGKDTKGILRVHQFDKVEMFVICTPATSHDLHEELLAMQEKLVQGLKLPYRVVQLCTGDMGFPSAKTYDIECWLPGQNGGKGEYRETHSTSNTTDYQARALNVRVKDADGKNVVAHMLNGTAFAMGRTIIAILENYQQADGSITIPDVLQPYMHGVREIR